MFRIASASNLLTSEHSPLKAPEQLAKNDQRYHNRFIVLPV